MNHIQLMIVLGTYCSFQELKIRLTKLEKDVGGSGANSTLRGLSMCRSKDLFQCRMVLKQATILDQFQDRVGSRVILSITHEEK